MMIMNNKSKTKIAFRINKISINMMHMIYIMMNLKMNKSYKLTKANKQMKINKIINIFKINKIIKIISNIQMIKKLRAQYKN